MTLLELQRAYAIGEVTAPVHLSEDYVAAYKGDTDGDWLDIETVFLSDPRQALQDALDLLGIPWEAA
jgi:hypothetical protein